jgi:hypothetical protein
MCARPYPLWATGDFAVTQWTSGQLDKIGAADELEIVTLRGDGSVRKPVPIWVVRLDDGLFVRSAYGRTPVWFRGIQTRRDGSVRAGGIEADVTFEAADTALNDRIDEAYWTKYRRHGARYVEMVVSQEARSTTIHLVPREPAA